MLGRLLRAVFRPSPDAAVLNEEGIRAWHAGELSVAAQKFRLASQARPRYAAACSNLGMVLVEQRHFAEGLDFLQRAVEFDPYHAGARVNLANTLAYDGQIDSALTHYEAALRLEPDNAAARINFIKPCMDACRWDEVEAETQRLAGLYRGVQTDWTAQVLPFVSLLLPLPAPLKFAAARGHADLLANRYGASRAMISALRPSHHAGRKIRLAYLSGDLRNNAVGHQVAGMFACHDRERFEVCVYSWGVDDGSEWRRRIESDCDRFADIRGESFEQSAMRIARDGMDILVNLSGYGGGSRNEIFAMRPAPVQIQWLGYPGTIGADFIDYMVADKVVLPASIEAAFTEAIVRLPNCYQVNDDRQRIADPAPPRAEFGLPESGFVFCSFNQSYKVDRAVFACWMRLLAAQPDSVLWMLVKSPGAQANLRAAAKRAGVAPERIIFASPLPKAEHLARHRLADLFLDTWCINGGTTASDALWSGLPLLTLAGAGFGGRVAASLLTCMGLDELIARAPADYERIALEVARNPETLRTLRGRVSRARDASPLFDTRGFVRDFEAALQAMMQRHRDGLPPANIDY
jgi:protein O-GlcNAc transferase